METDPSGFRFSQASHQKGIDYTSVLYKDWNQQLAAQIKSYTCLLARRPHDTNDIANNYFGLFRKILHTHRFKRIFDGAFYATDVLGYEDKIGKQWVMERLNLPVAQIIDTRNNDFTFPIIIKKRFAGRSKANYLITNKREWEQFQASFPIHQYMSQRYYPLKGDYRILVLGQQILGILSRTVTIGNEGRISVMGSGVGSLPKEVTDMAIKLQQELGTDLLGVDVGQKQDGSYFFIEYNFSPQFLGFERETGIDVATSAIEYLLK